MSAVRPLPLAPARAAADPADGVFRPAVRIGWRTRIVLWLIRWLIKPWARRLPAQTVAKLTNYQVRLGGVWPQSVAGQALHYAVLGGVGGARLGDLADAGRPVLLYLHGGGFALPISPFAHLPLFGHLCRELGAVGFMPEYRLTPCHPYPAALDDCERAYRGLLDAGFPPRRIALAGESAGGCLVLALLLRLKRLNLPMPACAVPISPITELCHVHSPPARLRNRRRDPFMPVAELVHLMQHYCGRLDTRHPEISPIYGDYRGLPPLRFWVGADEVLLDDTLIPVERARAAGVDASAEVWPHLPHAFPLLVRWFPEARVAQDHIAAFIGRNLAGQN